MEGHAMIRRKLKTEVRLTPFAREKVDAGAELLGITRTAYIEMACRAFNPQMAPQPTPFQSPAADETEPWWKK
jgi:hypothetical protein